MPELAVKTLILTGLCTFSSVGALALKRYADDALLPHLLAGLAAYMLSNWLWLLVARSDGLGYAATVPNLLTTLFLTVIGATYFGEAFGLRQILGLGFACLSILSFALPQ